MSKNAFLPLGLFLLLISSPSWALNICTMTFNSVEERATLKKVFSGGSDRHIELVPNTKDPHWFKNSCDSGVRCDVLLISGHFGGMFFGEKNSSILGLDEIEKASCRETCPNILNAKKVYLMGCNTLASKAPDHRSIEQYLKVLVQDGFPRNLAEEVVASRYVNYGLGISERMSLAFRNSQEIYGFSSTSPLGAVAAPKLERFLKGNKSSFSGTSFRMITPSKEISSRDYELQCGARSFQKSERELAYRQIISNQNLRKHFDLVLRNIDDEAVIENLKQLPVKSNLRSGLLDLAQSVEAKSHILIGAKFQVLKLMKHMDAITPEIYNQKIYSSLTERLSKGLDPINLDQVCSIARSDKELIFKTKWLENTQDNQKAYWARLYHCFKNKEPSAELRLKQWLSTNQSSTRREILRALKGHWSAEERRQLLSSSRSWSARDLVELRSSLGIHLDKSQCAGLGEDRAWDCFNSLKASFKNIEQCQNETASFQTEAGLGADWHCLQKFPQEIHLTTCLSAAEKYKNAEKADDFIQYCWDELRVKRLVNRSECMGFGQAMRIQGNQIKQNWNCMNQVMN